MKSFLFVSLSFLLFLVVAQFHQIPLGNFFAPTALLLVSGPITGFLLINVGRRNLRSFCRRVHQNKLNSEDEDIIFGVSCIGLIMGFVGAVLAILSILYQPGFKANVDEALKLAFGSLLYGLLPPMVVFPLKMNLFRDKQSGLRFYSVAGISLMLLLSFVIFRYVPKG